MRSGGYRRGFRGVEGWVEEVEHWILDPGYGMPHSKSFWDTRNVEGGCTRREATCVDTVPVLGGYRRELEGGGGDE